MVFLAYFGGNILNGVKLINMPMLWVLRNNIDTNNDYLPVLGGCPDHRVRIGGFRFGFEGPNPKPGLGSEIVWNRKYKGFATGWELTLGSDLDKTRNRLEGWFQIDIRIQTRLKYFLKIQFQFFIDYFLHFDDFWGF
jgi:hypothetical protein